MIVENIPSESGNYILVFSLTENNNAFVPRFSEISLLPGLYLYCGSAHGNGGLKSRVHRHLSASVNKFWHIDYIKDLLQPREVWIQISHERSECSFLQYLMHQKELSIPAIGFGSSDCRNHCEAHLIRLPKESNLTNIHAEMSVVFIGLQRVIITE